MKKNYIYKIVYLLILTFILMVFILIGCTHKHTYEDWIVENEPTYEQLGNKMRICASCGQKEVEEIPALGHTLVKDEEIEPTYTSTGLTEGAHCTKCEYVLIEQKIIPKLTEESFSYKVNFLCSPNVKIYSYKLSDFSDEKILTDIVYSRNENGELIKDGTGQIAFEILLPFGYQIEKFEIFSSNGFRQNYSEIKGPEKTGIENGYLITQITSDLTIFITSTIVVSDFPAIVIETKDGKEISSKDKYVTCSVSVLNADEQYCFVGDSAKIKGRGNSTWKAPKKPYKIKFDSKTNLFGNGLAKTWTLLAGYYDQSLVRTDLVYSVASVFDSQPYTSSSQFVDLFINGEYYGIYEVCMQVETGDENSNRVNINDKLTNTTIPQDIDFLIEMDRRLSYEPEGVFGVDWIIVNGISYAIKAPDTEDKLYSKEISDFLYAYLKNCMDILDTKVFNDVKNLINIESFVDSYIINEIFKNYDVGWSSFYMYIKDGILYAGPLWDFDGSIGNNRNLNEYRYDTLWAKSNPFATNEWFNKLLEIPEFVDLVKNRIIEKKNEILTVINDRLEFYYEHSDSFKRNFEVWEVFGINVSETPDELIALETWEEHLEYIREYLTNSINFVTSIYVDDNE